MNDYSKDRPEELCEGDQKAIDSIADILVTGILRAGFGSATVDCDGKDFSGQRSGENTCQRSLPAASSNSR